MCTKVRIHSKNKKGLIILMCLLDDINVCIYSETRKIYFYPKTGFYFRTCENGAGWHWIPCRISPRSEFFPRAHKNWHIMWGINLGLD